MRPARTLFEHVPALVASAIRPFGMVCEAFGPRLTAFASPRNEVAIETVRVRMTLLPDRISLCAGRDGS